SVGQMLISHVTGTPKLWNEMSSAQILVSKTNVVIGYNPIYEYAALPDVERIVAAIRRSVATEQERAVVSASVDRGRGIAEPKYVQPRSVTPVEMSQQRSQSITVPIMG